MARATFAGTFAFHIGACVVPREGKQIDRANATTVYMAPKLAGHGVDFRYIEAGPDTGYYLYPRSQPRHDYPRNFNRLRRSRLLWIGPGTEPTYPPDSIIADRAVRQLDPGMLGGPIEINLDQLFTRVR